MLLSSRLVFSSNRIMNTRRALPSHHITSDSPKLEESLCSHTNVFMTLRDTAFSFKLPQQYTKVHPKTSQFQVLISLTCTIQSREFAYIVLTSRKIPLTHIVDSPNGLTEGSSSVTKSIHASRTQVHIRTYVVNRE
jgi:hypothetical protein